MNKMGGNFAVRPAQGPHRLRESIPLQVMLRDKLHLALDGREAQLILHQKEGLVKVDKKIRRNHKYPVGFMDVIEIPKMKAHYRLLYDAKARFTFVKITEAEAKFKLCKIEKKALGPNKITYLVTHDGRTIRFADKDIKIGDTIKYNLEKNEVEDFIPMSVGNLAFCSDGNNRGRVGIIDHINKFDNNFDLITIKDANGHSFTTRTSFIVTIGRGNKSLITLPKGNGIALTIIEEAKKRESE
jgi:small subunit ribosomal protein S4e